MPLSSLRSVSVPLSDRKLPTFRAFSSTAMADAGMDDVQRRLMFEDDYLVAATGLQSLWSLALATVDVYAILVKRSLQNRRLVSLFAIGDGVTSTMTFAAAFATAGITVLIDNDLNSCSANHCVQFETSTALALISWFAALPSFLFNFWSLASSSR
ncbi:PREDICTED: CASP-like protein 5A2 [Brassica oleracea var. oleracea]|uniref:CASP-like protein n=1 Tax=Brassica oleracea var. oleracea TaxID=109376 RepID=A0A0D3AWT4_BRAOL|nr:PREDICTED: CASP-like protein 5A2 [Brassica oleracea var. oleracea]